MSEPSQDDVAEQVDRGVMTEEDNEREHDQDAEPTNQAPPGERPTAPEQMG